MKDLCLRIRDLIGCEIEPEHGETRVGDVRHSLADIELARDLAMHVAALNPAYATADDVPADVLAVGGTSLYIRSFHRK